MTAEEMVQFLMNPQGGGQQQQQSPLGGLGAMAGMGSQLFPDILSGLQGLGSSTFPEQLFGGQGTGFPPLPGPNDQLSPSLPPPPLNILAPLLHTFVL